MNKVIKFQVEKSLILRRVDMLEPCDASFRQGKFFYHSIFAVRMGVEQFFLSISVHNFEASPRGRSWF